MKPTPDLNRNDSNRNDYGRYRKLSSNLSFLNPAVSEFRVCGGSQVQRRWPPTTPVPGCWPSVSSGGPGAGIPACGQGQKAPRGLLAPERRERPSRLWVSAPKAPPGALQPLPFSCGWSLDFAHLLVSLSVQVKTRTALSFLDFPLKAQFYEHLLLRPCALRPEICAESLRFVPNPQRFVSPRAEVGVPWVRLLPVLCGV